MSKKHLTIFECKSLRLPISNRNKGMQNRALKIPANNFKKVIKKTKTNTNFALNYVEKRTSFSLQSCVLDQRIFWLKYISNKNKELNVQKILQTLNDPSQNYTGLLICL